MEHITDTDLERYYLGMIPDGRELADIEEHLVLCSECLVRAEENETYVEAVRTAIIVGNYD